MRLIAGLDGLSLDCILEPAVVVDRAGTVLLVNAAARLLFGTGCKVGETRLENLVEEDPGRVSDLLRRAARSTAPVPGSVTPCGPADRQQYRCLSGRFATDPDGNLRLIIRFLPAKDGEFSVLNQRLKELDKQLHLRRRENALLQEALADNRVLMSELQHRVKNNIQQMLTLIRMSAAGKRTAEVSEVVATASDRLRAMALTQDAIYRSATGGSISSGSFLAAVASGSADSYGAAGRLTMSIPDVQVTPEQAHCLALITNELITNACKYGSPSGTEMIHVTLARDDGQIRLEVKDEGPGFDAGTTLRSSGLMLVRALCRQIGASFDMAREQGTRCRVQFQTHDSEMGHDGQERDDH